MHFFLKQFLSIDRPKINAWVALRNTVGVALCFVVFILLGKPVNGLVAGLGALVVSYSDSDDAYVSRARRLFLSSLLSALAVFLGTLAIQSYPLAFFLAVSGAFLAGLVVALGPMETDLVLFSLVMFIIFATEPLPIEKAVLFGGLTLLGGITQTGLSIMFWPIRRFEPERRELGKLYLELSRLRGTPMRLRTTPLGSAQINRAHQALSGIEAGHGLEGDRYRSLLSQAERVRISLIYLLRRKRWWERKSRTTESPQAQTQSLRLFSLLLAQFLDRASEALGLIAQILFTAETAPRSRVNLERLEKLIAEARALDGSPAETIAQMAALSGQLRSATGLATRSVPAGTQAFAEREARRPWRLRFQGPIATLRANLTFKSAAFRHGLRMAMAIAVGEAIATLFRLERSYWIPMTIVLVLKPEFTSTLTRGLMRVLGTLAGLVFATLLFHIFPHGTPVEFVFVAGYMFMLRWVGAANYGIFTFMLSGLVVSLLALTGVDPNQVIFARGLNTCIGGLIALAAYWIWPTWARTQVQETIAQMLEAYKAYFHAVSSAYLKSEVPAGTMDGARLNSRVARTNQEAALAHTQAEPGTSEAQKRLLRAMQASSNRFAYNIMALEAGDKNSFSPDQQPIFKEFSEGVEETLTMLIRSLRKKDGNPGAPAFPDLRAAQARLASTHSLIDLRPELASSSVYAEIDRITNSLNTLREQISQWIAKAPPA